MKNTFFLFLIFVLSFTCATAQQDHFLYFQTEVNQAFYIKLGDKVFNSSPAGYLILPKLREGNYTLIFGFPKSEWPEEVINYTLEKDAGFLFKNFSDKGWGLFNLQSLQVTMPGEKLASTYSKNEEGKKDNFSDMLATVVNDSSIRQKDIKVKEEVSQPPKGKIAESNKPVAATKEISQKEDTSVQILYSTIIKNLELKNVDGIDMIYTDAYQNDKDTIKIFMPVEIDKVKVQGGSRKNENSQEKDVSQQEDTIKVSNQADSIKIAQEQALARQAPEKEQKSDAVTIIAADTIKSRVKEQSGDTTINIADTTKSTGKEEKVEFLPAKSGMINSNCRQYATEDDFLKLRKKMAAESNNDNMINAAKKVFKSRCFTVKDVKNLSALFLNDEGKYNFFDAAYPYVSDSGIFYTLENQLSDTYYIKRFEAMIHH